jgi:hypothetical protein
MMEMWMAASYPSFRTKRKAIRARMACMREILFAHLCISLIEFACLFPAVFMR